MFWFVQAVAAVEVSDPSACVDGGRLEDELSLLLGDADAARLVVQVHVTARDDRRNVSLNVVTPSGARWSRSLSLAVEDCPSSAEAAAISIRQGLAALPGWTTATVERARVRGAVDLTASSSTDVDGRFGVSGGVDVRMFGRTYWRHRLEVGTSLPVTVGDGWATLFTVAYGTGLTGVVGIQRHGLELGLSVQGGPLWAVGSGFDANATRLLPRISARAQAAWQSPGPLRVGLFTEVPMLRLVLVGADAASRAEAPLRIGLEVGLRLEKKDRDPGEGPQTGRP